jgi:hypothetical protein
MAIEHTITENGELHESQTVVNQEIFSPAQINDKINAINREIIGLQAELTVWTSRQTKLTELQAE